MLLLRQLVLFLLVVIAQSLEFRSHPRNMTVVNGTEVEFSCIVNTNDSILFLYTVNDTYANEQRIIDKGFIELGITNINPTTKMRNLTATALTQYNNTEIKCVAFVIGKPLQVFSDIGLLLVKATHDTQSINITSTSGEVCVVCRFSTNAIAVGCEIQLQNNNVTLSERFDRDGTIAEGCISNVITGYYDLYVYDVENDNTQSQLPAIIKNQVFVDKQATITSSPTIGRSSTTTLVSSISSIPHTSISTTMSSDLNVATSTIILITIAVLTWLTVFILGLIGTFVAVKLCIRARLHNNQDGRCNYKLIKSCYYHYYKTLPNKNGDDQDIYI